MSIPLKVTDNQTIPLNLRLETAERAAKAFYHAPNGVIKAELLLVIEDALPDSYARYTTAQGIVIERLDNRVAPPRIALHVEQEAAGHLCPNCKLDLLSGEHGEVVDAYWVVGKAVQDIVCRHCGQFWKVRA